jgi:hypothetical protein
MAFRLATIVSDSIRSPPSVQLRQNHPPAGNAASSARIADATFFRPLFEFKGALSVREGPA